MGQKAIQGEQGNVDEKTGDALVGNPMPDTCLPRFSIALAHHRILAFPSSVSLTRQKNRRAKQRRDYPERVTQAMDVRKMVSVSPFEQETEGWS